MDSGLVIIGLAAIVASVAIVAIVFGRGFKGQIETDKIAIEVDPAAGSSPNGKARG